MKELYDYWKRIREMEKEISRLREKVEKGNSFKEDVRKVQINLRA